MRDRITIAEDGTRTLKCDCGRKHEDIRLAEDVQCMCGRMYNGSGQALAHPSQWGEETGERFGDDGSYLGTDSEF